MSKYLFIFSCLIFLASCAEKEMDMSLGPVAPAEEEEQMGSFELTLTGDRKTRATTTTISKEQADNFLITIYKSIESLIIRSFYKAYMMSFFYIFSLLIKFHKHFRIRLIFSSIIKFLIEVTHYFHLQEDIQHNPLIYHHLLLMEIVLRLIIF